MGGRRPDGYRKRTRPGSDEAHAWRALHHWNGKGAVRLIHHEDNTSIIERVDPGTQLAQWVKEGRDDDATSQVCRVASLLHGATLPGEASIFPTVGTWGLGFDRYRQAQATTISPRLVDRADVVYRELTASQTGRVLLHGDLHHFNILLDGERGWLAIDPKGVIGEPAYDFGAMLRNPSGSAWPLELFATPAVIDRRIGIIVERTGLDRTRLAGWAFAQAVLSAVWSWEDGESGEIGIAVAESLLRIR